jgi:hypothetical protein
LGENRVRSREFRERFVAGDVVALDRALGQASGEFRVGAGELGDRTAASGQIAPNVCDHHNDAHAGSKSHENADQWWDQTTSDRSITFRCSRNAYA